MKKQAEQWLKYSKVDLLTIEKIKCDKLLTQSSAFHAHQSVEKSLKALLENKNCKVLKTHDLELLLGKVIEMYPELEVDLDLLDKLNQVYIDSRYPSDFGLLPGGIPTINQIDELYIYASVVFSLVEDLIG